MRCSSAARMFLLVSSWLALATPIAADPSLDFDDREISVDTQPPSFTPPDIGAPHAPFAAFDDLVTQGGSEPCPMQPANASGNAAQQSTVTPMAFAGTGSAAFDISPGNCDPAFADVWSIYEITFTTDTDYDFDLDATLVNASLLLENDGGTPFASVTDFTGPVASVQQLPADTYTIRVDVTLSGASGVGGPPQTDSGSYDFTLDLLPEPAAPVALASGVACLAALARLRSRARRRQPADR